MVYIILEILNAVRKAMILLAVISMIPGPTRESCRIVLKTMRKYSIWMLSFRWALAIGLAYIELDAEPMWAMIQLEGKYFLSNWIIDNYNRFVQHYVEDNSTDPKVQELYKNVKSFTKTIENNLT